MNRILEAIAAQRWLITPNGMNRIVAQLPEPGSVGEFMGDLFAARPEAAARRTGTQVKGSVAVISVRGPIVRYDSWFTMLFGGTSVEWLSQQLRDIAGDESIGAVLFDVDSPGGTIDGLPDLAALIRQVRAAKPTLAITNPYNCSAAYWISAQADEIMSTVEGWTGSVGVYTEHWDFAGYYAEAGIGHEFVQAGRYKTEGNEFEPLGEEARAHVQGLIDESYTLFVADVAKGRGVSVAQVKADYGEGRYFGAKDAKAKGLVDRIGTFPEAVARAGQGKIARRADVEVFEPVADAESIEVEGDAAIPPITSAADSAGALVTPDRYDFERELYARRRP